jgi:hypothetical protein
MLDSRRTWMRRIGTLVGVGIVLVGLYVALLVTNTHCRPSTPQRQYACDVGPPSHPHFVLGVMIAVAGLAILVASRRFLPYFEERPSRQACEKKW